MKSLLFGLLLALSAAAPMATAQTETAEAIEAPELTPAESLQAGIEAAQKRSWRTARVNYKAACDGGELQACTGLADLYRKGLGGLKNDAGAERLLKRACRQDEMNACATLGFIYNQGLIGEEPDFESSRSYYKIACDGDVVSACAAYGNQLYGGVGGRYERVKGRRLLEQTCDQEFEWSCERLVDLGFSKRSPF